MTDASTLRRDERKALLLARSAVQRAELLGSLRATRQALRPGDLLLGLFGQATGGVAPADLRRPKTWPRLVLQLGRTAAHRAGGAGSLLGLVSLLLGRPGLRRQATRLARALAGLGLLAGVVGAVLPSRSARGGATQDGTGDDGAHADHGQT